MERFESLERFPLFKGLSKVELTHVAAHTVFGFGKQSAGEKLAVEGKPCKRLVLVTNGIVRLHQKSADSGFRLEEDIKAPWMFPPQWLWGSPACYPLTITAVTDVAMMTLDHDEVDRLCADYETFRQNLLLTISHTVYRLMAQRWMNTPRTTEERIVRFLAQRAIYPAGKKTLYGGMVRMAEELNTSRADISAALNDMQSRNLLEIRRNHIVIPALEQLIIQMK